jgi:hypothetical protein
MALIQEVTYNIVGQGKPKKPKPKEWVKPFWFLFTIGWYVALSLIVPTGIGFWLDSPDKFDTHPLLTLVGFGLGTVIAFYSLYVMLRRFYREQKEQEKGKESR